MSVVTMLNIGRGSIDIVMVMRRGSVDIGFVSIISVRIVIIHVCLSIDWI